MHPARPKRTVKPVQRDPPPSAPIGTWNHSRILTSRSSAACKPVDSYLSLLLIATTGWDENYDDAERREIIDALPSKYRRYEIDPATGRLLCPIDASIVLDNPMLKQAISKVRDEITDGYHEVTWMKQAQKATHQRQDGVFDEYLRDHAEELFGDFAASGAEQARNGDDDEATASSDGEWSGKAPTKKPKLKRGQEQADKVEADVDIQGVATDM